MADYSSNLHAVSIKCAEYCALLTCFSISRREHRTFRGFRTGANAVSASPVSRARIACLYSIGTARMSAGTVPSIAKPPGMPAVVDNAVTFAVSKLIDSLAMCSIRSSGIPACAGACSMAASTVCAVSG